MTNPQSQTNWQIPRELPDLRRMGTVALDTEENDEGLRADPGGGEGPGPSNTAIRPRAAPVARRRRQSLSPTPTIINLKGVLGQWAR